MKIHFASVASGLCLPWALCAAAADPLPVNCGDRIQAPGRYVLAQDMDCSALTDAYLPAVAIVADGVQFDLKGFTLQGAISVSDAINVRISNGSVIVFSLGGLPAVSFTDVQNSRLEGLTIRNGGGSGAGVAISGGGYNLIRRNDIHSGAGEGLFVGGSAVAVSVIRNSISGTGLGLGVKDTVRDAVFVSNDITGSDMGAALISGSGILVEDCRVRGHIAVDGSRNTIRNNALTGPEWRTLLAVTGNDNLIQGNTAEVVSAMGVNADGIHVGGARNFIRGNTSSGSVAPGFDLSGPADTCTANKWRNNTFGSASPPCIR